MAQDSSNEAVYAKETDLIAILDAHDKLGQCKEYGLSSLYYSIFDHFPWCPNETSPHTRHAIYQRIMKCALSKDFEVTVNSQNHRRVRVSQDYVDAYLLEGRISKQPRNPLNYLRLLQPAFSREIAQFYYSACTFSFGSEKVPEQGLPQALRWVDALPIIAISSIRKLRVTTNHQALRRTVSLLPCLLHMIACSPPARSLLDIDLKISEIEIPKRTRSARHKMGLCCTWVEISGVHNFKIILDVVDDLESPESGVAPLVRSSFRKLRPETYNTVTNPRRRARRGRQSDWVFLKEAKRINFLQVLPAELRRMVFQYLIEAERAVDGINPSNTSNWSAFFHCNYGWRINRQFVREIRQVYYSTSSIYSDISDGSPQDISDEHELEKLLKLAGPEMVSSMSRYEICLKRYYRLLPPFKSWNNQLRWLVEVLNQSSLRPYSPRGVKRAALKSISIKYDCEGKGDVRIYLDFTVLIDLLNESVQPFTLSMPQFILDGPAAETWVKSTITPERAECDVQEAFPLYLAGHAIDHKKYFWGQAAEREIYY